MKVFYRISLGGDMPKGLKVKLHHSEKEQAINTAKALIDAYNVSIEVYEVTIRQLELPQETKLIYENSSV